MRWKPALNAFAITFNGRITPTGKLTIAKVGSTVNRILPTLGIFRSVWDRVVSGRGPCGDGDRRRCRWSIRVVRIGRLGDGGFLALSVGLAFDDEFVGGGLEPVHRGLGQEWVGHHGQDLWWFVVAGDDGRSLAAAFDDQLVEVGGLGGL
jgi:hypothetical protein